MTRKQIQIIDTAKTLFLRHGVRRITLKEICEKAGVSKVTFYRYYSNRDELVKYLRDKMLEEGFRRFDEISEQDMSYPEKIQLMTEWRREFFSGMSADFIEDVFSMDDLKGKIKERFFLVIRSAQDKREIKKEISPELIWLVAEKIYEMVSEGKWKSAVPDYGEFQAQMRALFFEGLLTEKATKNQSP